MELLRQSCTKRAGNSDYKAMDLSTTLLGSSTHAHNTPSARNDAPQRTFQPSELERNPVELERTRNQQPSAHHDVCREVIQARVSSSAVLLGLSAVCRTSKNADLYHKFNQTISYDKNTSSFDFCSRERWFRDFGCLL
jgi:hypothetical protein